MNTKILSRSSLYEVTEKLFCDREQWGYINRSPDGVVSVTASQQAPPFVSEITWFVSNLLVSRWLVDLTPT